MEEIHTEKGINVRTNIGSMLELDGLYDKLTGFENTVLGRII